MQYIPKVLSTSPTQIKEKERERKKERKRKKEKERKKERRRKKEREKSKRLKVKSSQQMFSLDNVDSRLVLII